MLRRVIDLVQSADPEPDIWWVVLDDPQEMAYLEFMAKKQTRRSISVSKSTYERLKTYCETNGISMSQFIERRVGDYLSCSTAPAAERITIREEPVVTKRSSAPPKPDQIFTF